MNLIHVKKPLVAASTLLRGMSMNAAASGITL
jgi:hypothetical protein